MPFSFPSSPTVGQQSTQNGRVYQWTGTAWELVATPGSIDGAAITTGTVAAARLGSGSPSSANFLRGDGAWSTPTASVTYATLTQAQNAISTAASNPLRVRDQLAKWKHIDLNQLVATTASGGSVLAYNNTYQMQSNATANGSALARIQNDVGYPFGYATSSSTFQGGGTTFWTRPQLFALRLQTYANSTNAVVRIQFGKSQATTTLGRMAAAGIGLEVQYSTVNVSRVFVLAHNGTALSAVDSGLTITLGNTTDVLLWSDAAGNVTLSINDTTFTTTGAPTTGSIAGFTMEVSNGGDAAGTGLIVYRYISYTALS